VHSERAIQTTHQGETIYMAVAGVGSDDWLYQLLVPVLGTLFVGGIWILRALPPPHPHKPGHRVFDREDPIVRLQRDRQRVPRLVVTGR
jgi:hypothetical protein